MYDNVIILFFSLLNDMRGKKYDKHFNKILKKRVQRSFIKFGSAGVVHLAQKLIFCS